MRDFNPAQILETIQHILLPVLTAADCTAGWMVVGVVVVVGAGCPNPWLWVSGQDLVQGRRFAGEQVLDLAPVASGFPLGAAGATHTPFRFLFSLPGS